VAEILVVDDDRSVAAAFERFLRHEGHTCLTASNAEDALRILAERHPGLVIMDVRMPGVDGLQALRQIRDRFPDVYVVVMTAYGTSQTSIDAIRGGAFEYLTKPPDLNQLRQVIAKALAARQGSAVAAARNGPEASLPPGLIGETPEMLAVYKMVGSLATNDVPALIVGEHGTGKELVVSTIHDNSARRGQPFTSLDCTALSEPALEAAIFGPAPRGQAADQSLDLRRAQDAALTGTIHLEDVEALPLALQTRLAHALEAGRTAARILASTTDDLAEAVQAGTFNRALHEVLAVITIRLPPLRERRADIPQLVQAFVRRFNAELNRTLGGPDAEAAELLLDHPWPGNVGELERVIKRACVLARGEVITADDVGRRLAESREQERQKVDLALVRAVREALSERLVGRETSPDAAPYHDIVELVESTLVKETLAVTKGNQVKAAELLGVNRATLRKRAPERE
jgi:DNA-binding NtrC family response regulator